MCFEREGENDERRDEKKDMQNLGVPADLDSFTVRTVYMSYHTA